jgi:hypothetical protein
LEAEWGARDLALHVVHKPTTSLRVVDCDGMPVNDYRAALVEGSNWGTGDFRSHPILDGRIDLGVHRPGQRVALVEFPRTSGRQPLVESVVISPLGGEITLRAGATASRRLRVQRPDETSVAGVRVQVCEMLGNAFDRSGLVVLDRGKWLVNTSAPRAFVLDETTTDADGATTIRGPVDRALGLRLVDAQSMPLEREDLRFDTGTDLAITLRAGARLRGKITPPAAIDELRRLARAMTAGFAEDRRPSLSFLSQGQRVWPRLNGQRENLRFAIADDGTFDVCGAPVGTWQLALVHWFVLDTGSGTRSLAVSDVTLRAGETCEVAIDLQRILPGGLRAQVFSNGQPLVEQRVMLQRMGGTERAAETPEWAPINTDAEGRFEHRCRPGEYCVELHSGGTRIASAPVTIVRGATIEHAFVLDVGTLQLHVVDAAGQPAASLTVDTHPGQGFGNTDTDGRVAILRSPGECTLRVLPKRLQSPQANASLEAARVKGLSDPYEGVWVLLGTATVLAGQTTKLELRLPPEFEK